MIPEVDEHSSNPDFQDSLEWGSIAKDCKAKIYYNIKTMNDNEIKVLIDRANNLRKLVMVTRTTK
jgi:hypothetical protein